MSSNDASKRRGYLPGRWFLIPLLPALAALAWLWFGDGFGDEGMRNVFTLMIGFLLFAIGALWFLFRSGYSRGLRLATLIVLVLAGLAFKTMFEVRGFSGSMIPDIRFSFLDQEEDRFDPERMQLPDAETVDAENLSVDLRKTSPTDWPGFMGPDRTATVGHLALDRDWESSPPELLWQRSVGDGWSSFAAVGGVAVTQEQFDGQERVTAYFAENGYLQFSTSFIAEYDHPLGGPGPRATPLITLGRIVALFPGGRLVCLRGYDQGQDKAGDVLWERDLLADYHITPEREAKTVHYGRANSPLAYRGLVIVPAGGGADETGQSEEPGAGLIAIDLSDGTTVWESPMRVPSYSSPTLGRLHGSEQVLIVNESSVSGHDPESGELLWEHPWPSKSEGDSSNSQPLIVGEDRVLVSRGYGAGCALIRIDVEPNGAFSTEQLWHQRRSLRTKLTSAVQRGGYAYGLSDGMLECIELEAGGRIWKEGRYGHGQLLLVGDLLLLISEEGVLHLIEASPEGEGEVLATHEAIRGKTWNWPALYGDLLLVRNGAEAACFRLAGTPVQVR